MLKLSITDPDEEVKGYIREVLESYDPEDPKTKVMAELMADPAAFNAWVDREFGVDEDQAFKMAAAALQAQTETSTTRTIDVEGNATFSVPQLGENGKVIGVQKPQVTATESAETQMAVAEMSEEQKDELLASLYAPVSTGKRKRDG